METYTITFMFKDNRPQESYKGIGVPTTDGTHTIINTLDKNTVKILKSEVKQFHTVFDSNNNDD